MLISPELKEAILSMPEKEKDKLLLKFIAKDNMLIQKLQFQLLDNDSMEARRKPIEAIINKIYAMKHGSAGWMMMDMRSANSYITEHVKVTKDKFGEVYLTLKLINDCFSHQLKWVEKHNDKNDTLAVYLARRVDFAFKKYIKLNEDWQYDLGKAMNRALQNAYKYAPKTYAADLDLPEFYGDYGVE